MQPAAPLMQNQSVAAASPSAFWRTPPAAGLGRCCANTARTVLIAAL